MNENELMKALDKSSDATQVPLDSFGLIKVGDWVWGEGGFGQVTQIFHDYYEEYDDFKAWNAKGKSVGDYMRTYVLMKYFCTWEKVRRNATGFTSVFPETKPIVEGDVRGRWNIIQNFIKEYPEKYLAYQKYKPRMVKEHIHIFYHASLGNGHTKEYYTNLFGKIFDDLPKRFTFPELVEIAQKHQCPFRIDKPKNGGRRSNMCITLFYNVGEYRGKRKLFCGYSKYVYFS